MYHFHMYKGVQEDVSDVSSQLCSYIHYNKMYLTLKKEKSSSVGVCCVCMNMSRGK